MNSRLVRYSQKQAVPIQDVITKVMHRVKKSMNKPLQDFKHKGLSVAVWEARNGGYSFSVQKRYKDKQTGEWKESKYYYKEEVDALIDLLKQAASFASNRAEHQHEGIPSGQGKPGAPVQYELTQADLDDIPF